MNLSPDEAERIGVIVGELRSATGDTRDGTSELYLLLMKALIPMAVALTYGDANHESTGWNRMVPRLNEPVLAVWNDFFSERVLEQQMLSRTDLAISDLATPPKAIVGYIGNAFRNYVRTCQRSASDIQIDPLDDDIPSSETVTYPPNSDHFAGAARRWIRTGPRWLPCAVDLLIAPQVLDGDDAMVRAIAARNAGVSPGAVSNWAKALGVVAINANDEPRQYAEARPLGLLQNWLINDCLIEAPHTDQKTAFLALEQLCKCARAHRRY